MKKEKHYSCSVVKKKEEHYYSKQLIKCQGLNT